MFRKKHFKISGKASGINMCVHLILSIYMEELFYLAAVPGH